jgi:hypothetical protein
VDQGAASAHQRGTRQQGCQQQPAANHCRVCVLGKHLTAKPTHEVTQVIVVTRPRRAASWPSRRQLKPADRPASAAADGGELPHVGEALLLGVVQAGRQRRAYFWQDLVVDERLQRRQLGIAAGLVVDFLTAQRT